MSKLGRALIHYFSFPDVQPLILEVPYAALTPTVLLTNTRVWCLDSLGQWRVGRISRPLPDAYLVQFRKEQRPHQIPNERILVAHVPYVLSLLSDW